MGDIVDKAYVKTHLSISGTGDDTAIDQWIDNAERLIASYIDRPVIDGNHPLKSAQVTEYYDGNGLPTIRFNRYPVTAVSLVSVDNNGYYNQGANKFPSSGDLTIGTHVAWNAHELIKLTGETNWAAQHIWSPFPGSIKVTYTAGYAAADMPDDLKLAAAKLVGGMRRQSELGIGRATASEKMGNTTIEFQDLQNSTDIAEIQRILDRFKAY